MEERRVCTKCGVSNVHGDFYKCSKVKIGLQSNCKMCAKENLRNYRKSNREKVRAAERKYYAGNKGQASKTHKKYREQNKEKINAVSRVWKRKNKERLKVLHDIWYENNKEIMKLKRRTYYLKNKDKCYSRVLKRRSLKHSVVFSGVTRKGILDRDNWTCQICGVGVHDRNAGGQKNRHLWDDERKAHLDHVIPISKGGDSTPENMQALCRTCNQKKSNKTELEIDKTGQIKMSL